MMMSYNNDDGDSMSFFNGFNKTHIETCVISGRHPNATISTKSIEI